MLSTRQYDAYCFIRNYILRHQAAPLLDEIAVGLGIHSKGVVHRYVQAIAAEGLIKLEPGRHRGIRLCQDADGDPANTTLPLLGRIAAGRPIEAIAGQNSIDLSAFLMGPDRFVLKVQGDSMVDAGILDGDMVIVQQRDTAEDDDIVVALVDNDEATLKRLRHDGDGSVSLLPANSAMAPLIYSAERIRIQGVVVGQMRTYP